MKRFRLTLIFVLTALVVLAATTFVVNLYGLKLASDNLIRITEENTARDAAHIQSMMRGPHSTERADRATPLTLESLAGPQGLPRHFPVLVEGLNIVKFNLTVQDDGQGFDVEGASGGLGMTTMQDYAEAAGGRGVIHSAPGEGTEVTAMLPFAGPGAGHPESA